MIKRLYILFLCLWGEFIFAGNPDSLIKIAQSHKRDSALVLILADITGAYDILGEYDKAISYGEKARILADSLHYKFGLQSAYNNTGNCYIDKGDLKIALDYHLKALKIREELGNKQAIAYTYLNLGNIYFKLNEEDKAQQSYDQSMKMLLEVGDTFRVATCLSNIGSIYSNKLQPQKAEEYYLKALAIRKRYGDLDAIAETYSNLSIILMDAKKYKEALAYAFETITLYKKNNNKLGNAISYSNIGDIYQRMGDNASALKYQEIALQLSVEMKSLFMIQTCYQLLADVYKGKGDYTNALKYFELYSQVSDSIMNTENSKFIAEMQTRFETEKKEKEIELLQKDKNIRELQLSRQDADIRKQRIIIFSVVGGLVIIIVLILFILKSYREKKKINIGLERKNIEINLQKDLIEEKNTLITDSIDYARNIQNAILPSDELIENNFPESFILFLPKDVVSGDFYWLSPSGGDVRQDWTGEESVLFATIDCTGHGVPGAFMSVMAFNMLENIVIDKKLTQPSLILDELNKTVRESLKQDAETTSVKYGMDISLIAFSKTTKKLQFAGAHNPLYIIRNGELIELKASKTTVGMALEKFTDHSVQFQKGDTLYLFTDGYADQKGGVENKKLFASEFKELLISVSKNPMEEQREKLLQFFTQRKGVNEQLDDVLLVGIKI